MGAHVQNLKWQMHVLKEKFVIISSAGKLKERTKLRIPWSLDLVSGMKWEIQVDPVILH